MNNKVKIGSFCKVRRGASPRPIDNPNYFGGDVGWIRISDVTKSFKYLNKTEQYVSPLGESLSVRVDKGDLVMSICGTIGRPIIINIPSCIHDGFVQLYDIQEADKEYLYYILQHHEKDLERKGQPGTQVNLNTTIVENFEIYFPAKLIQTKIAKILSTADAVIEKTQATIAKYKAIKQGMLQDLFTRGIDISTNKLRPRFEDAPHLYKVSKLGMIPVDWDVEKIEDTQVEILDGDRGLNYPKENDLKESGYCLFLSAANVTKDGFKFSTTQFISKERDEMLGAGKLTRNDTIVTTRGTVGNVVYYGEEVQYDHVRINSGMVILRNNDNKISNSFLFQYVKEILFEIYFKDSISGTAQPQLPIKDFKKLILIYPKDDTEQNLIAERIKAINNKLEIEQTYLQKMQSLKKGLMEDLLSGKLKVKN